jgi:acetolactate synthase-1/3 small subunit
VKRRIVSALLENEAGALSRVVGLFAQRNYNIESLTVAPTEDSSLSRLTLTTSASDAEIEQITKQRELMLVKVKAGGAGRGEVKRLADIFRAQIVDVTSHLFTIQVIGTTDKLDAFIEALSEGQVVEVVRTGVTGLSRGDKTLSL